jgi:hypothetical protein
MEVSLCRSNARGEVGVRERAGEVAVGLVHHEPLRGQSTISTRVSTSVAEKPSTSPVQEEAGPGLQLGPSR